MPSPMRFRSAAVLAAVLLAAAAPLMAQAQAPASPTDDERAVRAVIDRLFDGMRTRDTTAMRSAFADGAQLFGVGRDGSVRAAPASDFITSISRAPEGMVLDEVIRDVEIRIDGPLATAWMYYDFFAGPNFSHCGYNAFQLLRTGDEWKVVAITDSRRQEGCRQQRAG